MFDFARGVRIPALGVDGFPLVRAGGMPVSETFLHRLCEFYCRQALLAVPMSPIWEGFTAQFQQTLHHALLARDCGAVAALLAGIYDGPTLAGMDYCNLQPDAEPWFRLHWKRALFAAGWATGAARVLNVEQDDVRETWEQDAEQILTAIEAALGTPLTCIGAGGVCGLQAGGRFVPVKLLLAAAALSAMRRLHDGETGRYVTEFGAGAGWAARLALLSCYATAYHTVDLPFASVVHAALLAREFGEESVWLHGEPEGWALLYVHGLALGTWACDVAFSQDSLPEMAEAAPRYVAWMQERLPRGGVFLSKNHEAPRGGQVRVFELMKAAPRMRPLYRCPLWWRAGYLEEAWVKA